MTAILVTELAGARRQLIYPRFGNGADEITRATVALWPTAHRFRRGHRIRPAPGLEPAVTGGSTVTV